MNKFRSNEGFIRKNDKNSVLSLRNKCLKSHPSISIHKEVDLDLDLSHMSTSFGYPITLLNSPFQKMIACYGNCFEV